MDADYVEAVLAVVAAVPPGRVTTYGAVAAVVGRAGPRQVGQVLSRHGSEVAWWRVVRADGTPPACHDGTGPALLRAEDTPLLPDGRVDLARAATRRGRAATEPGASGSVLVHWDESASREASWTRHPRPSPTVASRPT